MKQFNPSEETDASLAEELPYWEFNETPFPYVLLTDGSVSAGIEVMQVDIECFDGSAVNSLTEQMRSLMNSVGEGVMMQWVLSIDSDFESTIAAHEASVKEGAPAVLANLEKFRTMKLREQMANGLLYRPKLSVYLNVKPIGVRSSGFFASHAEFNELSRQQMAEQLSDLKENLDSLMSALSSIGLSSTATSLPKMIESIYRHLNPKRSRTENAPLLKDVRESQLDPETLVENPWLAVSSPRSELVFGDLILNLERFTLDSTLHAVITLKTLPEVTYAGMLSSLLRLPFHYDLVMTVDVPPKSRKWESFKPNVAWRTQ